MRRTQLALRRREALLQLGAPHGLLLPLAIALRLLRRRLLCVLLGVGELAQHGLEASLHLFSRRCRPLRLLRLCQLLPVRPRSLLGLCEGRAAVSLGSGGRLNHLTDLLKARLEGGEAVGALLLDAEARAFARARAQLLLEGVELLTLLHELLLLHGSLL